MSPLLRLRDGSSFNLADPNYAAVSVKNIVHGLAGAIRFGGQSPRRVTVAEHTAMGARHLAHPGVAEAVAISSGLQRLREGLRTSAPALCERLRRAFLIHDFTEAVLHDLTSPLKRMDALAGYRRLEQLHMERIANVFGVPYVNLDRQTAAEYEAGYRAAWARCAILYPQDVPTPDEMEAHLLTAEIWAAVHAVDGALGQIEMVQAWADEPTSGSLCGGAQVIYDFLSPDAAYTALFASLPDEWIG